LSKLVKFCFRCGNKLSRPLTVKDNDRVSCGICFSKKLEGIENEFAMNEISNSKLEDWK